MSAYAATRTPAAPSIPIVQIAITFADTSKVAPTRLFCMSRS